MWSATCSSTPPPRQRTDRRETRTVQIQKAGGANPTNERRRRHGQGALISMSRGSFSAHARGKVRRGYARLACGCRAMKQATTEYFFGSKQNGVFDAPLLMVDTQGGQTTTRSWVHWPRGEYLVLVINGSKFISPDPDTHVYTRKLVGRALSSLSVGRK